MHEINKIDKPLRSLSIFVGTGKCNAHCAHCAGIPHRKYAPKEDGILDSDLIYSTLREGYIRGARSLSLSSSGEPTLSPLSVTYALTIANESRKEGMIYSPINLYSNGIRIGEDEEFSKHYLPLWQSLGLTTVYITVHDIDAKRNAWEYGITHYPSLEAIVSRIHNADLRMRANLVLKKGTVDTSEKFVSTVLFLKKIRVDAISAWPVRNLNDAPDSLLMPNVEELSKMREWANKNQSLFGNIRIYTEEDRKIYQSMQKLTLFPDGTLSNKWCT